MELTKGDAMKFGWDMKGGRMMAGFDRLYLIIDHWPDTICGNFALGVSLHNGPHCAIYFQIPFVSFGIKYVRAQKEGCYFTGWEYFE